MPIPGGSENEYTRNILFGGRFLAAVLTELAACMTVLRQRQRWRPTQLHPSEIMTSAILFHQSHYRTCKAYDTEYVHRHLRRELPTRVRYQRFASVDAHRAGPIGWFYGFKLHLAGQ
jgi:hypothetical protein